jgi:AraC-like DNA-binding protein
LVEAQLTPLASTTIVNHRCGQLRGVIAVSAVTTIANEVSESVSALSRLQLDVVRTGAGSGPNALLNVDLDGVDLYSSLMRFPAFGQMTVADKIMVVTLIVTAPPGTRWGEIDLAAGDVLVYGPGSRHTSVNPEGLEYRSAVIQLSALDEVADSLQTPSHHPASGSVMLLNPTAGVRELAVELLVMGNPLNPSDNLPTSGYGVLRAAVNALASAPNTCRSQRIQAVQSRDVVHECIEYADAVGRRPSIPELCTIACVSERRLRTAFHDVFGVAPNAFFRTRYLSHARDRLLIGVQSVTEVASDLGFEHLGRFARQYARTYGEHPRETLARARNHGRPPSPARPGLTPV